MSKEHWAVNAAKSAFLEGMKATLAYFEALPADRAIKAVKKSIEEREVGLCEHGDMDEGHCLDCGLDRTEELSALAYDRAKDARKYGDV